MKNNLVITSAAAIRHGKAICNNILWCEDKNNEGYSGFSRLLYKKLNLAYPKFYKMDNMSKLAILCSELLFTGLGKKDNIQGPQMSVMLSNSASSLDTDRVFHESVNNPENYFPSPAVFVYTLPNIAIGEICIKNKITGENAFFIFDRFDSGFTFDYVSELLLQNRAEACLCGWCDFDDGKADAFFMMVEKGNEQNNKLVFNVDNIDKLYKKT